MEEIKIDLYEFVSHVDDANSGADRDCVFAYLEDFLKREKGIEVDIYKMLGIDEDEED